MYIFTFHQITSCPRLGSESYAISQKGLSSFIATLRAFGIRIVSLREELNERNPFSEDFTKAILTFDDGYENNFDLALPVLQELRCPATLFILPGCLGATNRWDLGHLPEEQQDRLMSKEQIVSMSMSPYITFGSHTMTHADLSRLHGDDLSYEIEESFCSMQSLLGEQFLPVMAYPYGRYSSDSLKAMRRSSFRYAFTTEITNWNDPYRVPRYFGFSRDALRPVLAAKLIYRRLVHMCHRRTRVRDFRGAEFS